MKHSRKVLFTCIAVALALLLITNPRAFAQAEDTQDCTTLAVGKAASSTGEVLLGHNEDDGGRMAYSQMHVPRMFHAPGSFVNGGNLGSGMAQIPDVPETYAYYWSDSITPGGAANADIMQNEFGVTVFSNAMTSRERCTTTCLVNGGIDYGLNTIVIQRATSARNGVEIAAALVTQWGYNSSGRNYMIADAKEAWFFQAVKGHHYVAQRVGDNEVAVLANRYTIRKVDMVDATTTHTKFYASPDLVTYAIAQGWYTPAVPGNYSDFDFAPTYQGSWTSGSQQDGGNTIRQWHGYEMLTGQSWQNDTGNLPFSVVATRQLGRADLLAVGRTHYEGTPDDLTDGYTTVPSTPHYTADRVICTASTMENTVWQLRDNTLFNVMWRTTLRPEGPSVPWYPQTGRIPNGYSFTTPVYAQTTHFTPAVTDYQYDPSRAFWAFSDLQNLIDPMYGQEITFKRDKETERLIYLEIAMRDELEKNWAAKQHGIEELAMFMYRFDPKMASNFLAEYTNQSTGEAWDWAKNFYRTLATVKIQIMVPQISLSDTGTVSVAILSNRFFDATTITPASISIGAGYTNAAHWAKAISVALEDVNGDGKTDMVATFNIPDIVNRSKGDITFVNLQDVFLQGTNNGTIFVSEAVVPIVP